MRYQFALPYPPSVNHYLSHTMRGMYRTVEANAYRDLVGWTLRGMGLEPLHSKLAVTIRAFRPRKSGDIDGILKVSLDAMNKLAYDDDSQIIELHVYRDDDKKNPRLEVDIQELA